MAVRVGGGRRHGSAGRAAVGMALALAVVLAGCGGDDPAETAEAAATASEATPVAAAEGTEEPKDDAELALPADAALTGTDPVDEDADAEEPDPEDADAGDPEAGPGEPDTDALPGGRYVQITDIRTEGQTYAVEFDPYNFEPFIGTGSEDFHIHFFFDDVAPENAGTNGPAPEDWFLYDGGSPFTGYSVADRPPAATQMCALVADAAHGITVGSGNCMTLP